MSEGQNPRKCHVVRIQQVVVLQALTNSASQESTWLTACIHGLSEWDPHIYTYPQGLGVRGKLRNMYTHQPRGRFTLEYAQALANSSRPTPQQMSSLEIHHVLSSGILGELSEMLKKSGCLEQHELPEAWM